MRNIYQLRNVSWCHTGCDGVRHTALSLDNFAIRQGEIVGVSGANGSGKSTLLRLLAFLETPSTGDILFRGRCVAADDLKARRQVTLLTQEPYLLHRTVAANVAYGLKARGQAVSQESLARELERVRLDPDEFLPRQWFQLSGGETQRVALAARLVLRPRVLLLDEPTASLDEDSSLAVRQAVQEEREKRGTTLVIVSHDLPWLGHVADRIIRLCKGHMVA